MNPNETTTEDNLRQNSQIAEYEEQEKYRLGQLENQRLKNLSDSKKNKSGPASPEMGLTTFALMLGAAGLVDLISFGMDFIPVVGGAIEAVTLTPISMLGFWMWCKIKGISMTKGIRGPITAVVIAIGFIPVVNALPEWTCEILMLRATMLVEKEMKKVPGIKKIAGK